jgi:predicted DNA-binding protein YlxM (UPF0122 family)
MAGAAAQNATSINAARMSLLFDYYGGLLGERHREIFTLYHEENLSLSEVAAGTGISRQGVHEALKKAETVLTGYEDRLGLLAKHEEYLATLAKIDRTAAELLGDEAISRRLEKRDEDRIKRRLCGIRSAVAALDI